MCAGLGLGPRTPPDPLAASSLQHSRKTARPTPRRGWSQPDLKALGVLDSGWRPSVRMAVGPQNRRKAGGRMAEPSTPKQQGTPQMCEALNCTSHSSCS